MKKKVNSVIVTKDRLIFTFYGDNLCEFWAMEYKNLEDGEWKAEKI